MAYGQKAVERARRQARAGATEDDIRRNLESDFQAETDRQVGASRASRASSLAADAKQKADAKSNLIRAGAEIGVAGIKAGASAPKNENRQKMRQEKKAFRQEERFENRAQRLSDRIKAGKAGSKAEGRLAKLQRKSIDAGVKGERMKLERELGAYEQSGSLYGRDQEKVGRTPPTPLDMDPKPVTPVAKTPKPAKKSKPAKNVAKPKPKNTGGVGIDKSKKALLEQELDENVAFMDDMGIQRLTDTTTSGPQGKSRRVTVGRLK